MKWNDNVVLFTPSTITKTIINRDGSVVQQKDTTQDEIPDGQAFITVTLTDHSMFDRYYKDDLLKIKRQSHCENGQGALVELPDHSVILRQIHFVHEEAILKALNADFYPESRYPLGAIKIIGIVASALRIN